MIQNHNSPQPWYVKKKNSTHETTPRGKSTKGHVPVQQVTKLFKIKCFCVQIFPSLLCILFLISAALCFVLSYLHMTKTLSNVFFIIGGLIFAFLGFIAILYQIGSVCSYFSSKNEQNSCFSLALKYLQGQLQKEEVRSGIPAPEMALYQFVQQVRAYATEKSFLKQKQDKNSGSPHLHLQNSDPNVIIKRRWNDVMDSLNEFEIYLANDPNGIIEKLVAKSPLQNTDVSQIFRDVAETFDTTWRRKGINIEQAIVTPLKANTNEALLRRLLVGPWRSCVYFARRGNEVIFTAKSNNGKIIAHWECEGVVYPEEFYEVVGNNALSVNGRIEKGMTILGSDPSSPNMLFALISFVTWLDLANASASDYSIKQGSEGLIIELRI
ncbi:MAG: hypothetical protein V4591_08560 [Bdellovibrionota bacterium]